MKSHPMSMSTAARSVVTLRVPRQMRSASVLASLRSRACRAPQVVVAAVAGGGGLFVGATQSIITANVTNVEPLEEEVEEEEEEVDTSPTRDELARPIPILARIGKVFAFKKAALAKVKAA